MQMYAIARFSNWLQDRQLDLQRLDENTVKRFLRRDPDISHSAESATLSRLLGILRQIGVTMAKLPESRNQQQRFADEYRRYLLYERGLAEATAVNYVPFAEQFLFNSFGAEGLKLSELGAANVTKFIQDRARELSPGSARKGAHLFSHTLATDLLRRGASLEEIGELLRHRSPNTTALYAKVD
jgi:site-specific recombinase XerD